MKKKFIIFGLIALLLIITGMLLERYYSIDGKIPQGVVVIDRFRSTGFGNGDYTYAFKAEGDRAQYSEFCNKVGVSPAAETDSGNIGFDSGSGYLPDSEKSWWDEPEKPEVKSYLRQKRSFTRITYSKGLIYYISEGW